MNVRRISFALDAGGLDDRPPFGDFGLPQRSQRLRVCCSGEKLSCARPTADTAFVVSK
jgi:hypothetical protein